MNWWKRAQQQYLWDNDPRLPQANIDRSSIEISGDIKSDVEEATNIVELQNILFSYGIEDLKEFVFEEAKEKIWVFTYSNNLYVIELSFPYPSLLDAREWIYKVGDNAWQYLDFVDYNKEFWDNVSEGDFVYHGTNEENIEDIKREGLIPMYGTRGISNRMTGPAIFASPTAEIAENYYPIVIEINLGKMKADRYFPRVGREEPIEKAEASEVLANKIGLENFYSEYEEGLDPETVIFYDSIPLKYLRIL